MSHVKCLRVTFQPSKTRPSRYLATSDIDHSLTEPHIQVERRRHLCQCESLKTRKLWFVHQNVHIIYGKVQWTLTFVSDYSIQICLKRNMRLNMNYLLCAIEASWNVLAHAQEPDIVFQRNGRVHLNRRGRQFSRLLAAEVCASAVVMLDTPCSEVVWRVLATHSIRQFPFHFPSRASPCAITFQLDSTTR